MYQNGEFSLVNICSVPRSMSTILEISLAEIFDAQVNEVFNRGQSDLEVASKSILDILNEKRKAYGKFILITKNISSEIAETNYLSLLEVSDLLIFTIRDPLIQTASLIERVGNDKLSKRGAAKLSFEDLLANGDFLDTVFADRYNFVRNGWEDLYSRYKIAQNSGKKTIIIDGTLLCIQPQFYILEISKLMNRDFNENAISNWTKASQENFNNPNHYDFDYDENRISKNKWVSDANRSISFKKNLRDKPQMSVFMENFPRTANYITEIAFPIYRKLQSSDNFMSHRSIN